MLVIYSEDFFLIIRLEIEIEMKTFVAFSAFLLTILFTVSTFYLVWQVFQISCLHY